MSDLISRRAAIGLIERMKPYHQNADDIAEMIANMPSAQPVRHGQWLERNSGLQKWIRCSSCGSRQHYTDKTNYCPNCGADMRGDQE